MQKRMSRRAFVALATATSAAVAVGPQRWGWAAEGSPFAPLQDDPLLRLPDGFSYKVIAETGMPLTAGPVPFQRPHFPDLNVVRHLGDGKVLLSTSHEVPAEFPLPGPPPNEDYDRAAGGAITSLIVDRDLSVLEGAYNAGGMVNNCSGAGTPWGTVLTGEESTATLEADHGFIWEVDPIRHTKTRLDDMGRFDHETAVVDARTGIVYLTEDSGGDSLLYRFIPKHRRHLERGGRLQAYRRDGGKRWVDIDDPLGKEQEPSAQGVAKGALRFERLEGGRIRGRWFYFTETEDAASCGKIWRLHLDDHRLELWAEGKRGRKMVMPDNLIFDPSGNMWVTEDKPEGLSEPNRILFIDRSTGKIATFGEIVNPADETTGPAFALGGRVLFINLQRSGGAGLTLAITGPFGRYGGDRLASEAAPREAQPLVAIPAVSGLDVPLLGAAALVNLRRRGRAAELEPDLELAARELGPPMPVEIPKVREPKQP